MRTADFIREHGACREGAKWALSIGKDMSAVWDAMIEQSKHEWLLWTVTRPGVFPDFALRKLACRFVRETPVANGRTLWDLLTDERSRKAIEVAERYADGNATEAELYAAYSAANDAYVAAYSAACDAACDAARAAAWAAYDSAYAAAYAAACAAARAERTVAFYDARADAYDAACAAANADANAAAWASAKSAQIKMIAEIGNPFNKEA